MSVRRCRTYTVAAALVAGLCLVALAGGCQTPGQVVSQGTSMECPDCHVKLVTSAIEGINFEHYTCPACHKEYEVDASGGYLPPKEVLVCPHCGEVFMECPTCKAMHGK